MRKNDTIACVTGGSGLIGRKIVEHLLTRGYKVRILSRSRAHKDPRFEVFSGSLMDESILRSFVSGAQLLFHCAAEINDESKMWAVNVTGTSLLFKVARDTNIRYFCHISSVDVVGITNHKWNDENVECAPISAYGKSKWESEKIVSRGIDGCQIVILRPGIVIDEHRPGPLSLPMNGTLACWLNAVIKGRECSHIVHTDNVAAAAMYFISYPFNSVQRYFVSCDHEPLNTYAGIWALYKSIKDNKPLENVRGIPSMPLVVPYLLRTLFRGRCNWGDVRYSSEKLFSEGFSYPIDLYDTVKKTVSASGVRKR